MSLFGSSIFTGVGGSGIAEFTELTDTPASYSGEAYKIVAVNSGETGLEFIVDIPGNFPVVDFTGTAKNLVVADNLTFFAMDNAAAQTVTIPENASEAFPIGSEMEFLRENATGTVSFAVSGTAVMESRDNLVTINAQYSAAALKKVSIDGWRLIGDLA